MISVIVPVYNVAPFLEEAIESVVHQTYTDLEIILVDDGSTDGSGEICDRYQKKDSRIKVIHQENRGLSAARNAGLDICKGEMIAFLDADDAFCEDMLRKMSDAMADSGADIVECNYAPYYGNHPMDPQKLRKKRKYGCPTKDRTGLFEKKDALLMRLDGKIETYAWNKLYHRKVWNSLRFREGLNYEDLDIILPLLGEAERVYIFGEPLVMYRVRPGSITATHTFENVCDRSLAYRHYFEYVQSHSPEYFDEESQGLVLKAQYTSLLEQYFDICACRRSPERQEYIDSLGKQIKEARRGISLRSCCRKTQAASLIYSFAPPDLAGMIFRVYRSLKMLIWKVIGR